MEAKFAVWIVSSLLTMLIPEAPRRSGPQRENSDHDF